MRKVSSRVRTAEWLRSIGSADAMAGGGASCGEGANLEGHPRGRGGLAAIVEASGLAADTRPDG